MLQKLAKQARSRLRIPLGAMAAVLTLLTLGGSVATANAASRGVVVFSGGGFQTALVMVNPTPAPIALWTDTSVSPAITYSIAPGEVQRRLVSGPMAEPLAVMGGEIDVPAGLKVYTRVYTPVGAIADVPALEAVEEATFYDLQIGKPYNSAVVVVAAEAAVIAGKILSVGQAVVVPAKAPTVTVKVDEGGVGFPGRPTGRKFWAFAYINHEWGSIQIVPAN